MNLSYVAKACFSTHSEKLSGKGYNFRKILAHEFSEIDPTTANKPAERFFTPSKGELTGHSRAHEIHEYGHEIISNGDVLRQKSIDPSFIST